MAAIRQGMTRFDTRLSLEQKQFFERAAQLGGYRNLTDFILLSAQERAREIIEKNEQILASERDRTLFFDALTNPAPPNEALVAAATDYKARFAQ